MTAATIADSGLAFIGSRDLEHRADPVSFGFVATEGEVIARRCASCGGGIWRTAERPWSHSVPSRTSRLADPLRARPSGPVDVVLTRHLQEA